MNKRLVKAGIAVAAALAFASCEKSGTVNQVRVLDGGRTLVTSADLRVINRVKVVSDNDRGRIKPDYVTCAEPSPDVAKAVATAFELAGKVKAEGLPQGIEPELALAISRSRAESVAQLAERLATIQLLRDGLYRACEAYANGAISETTYAVMLSRYDDTMVTMLLGEFAAGAFGRSLATLGGAAKGGADTGDANGTGGEAEAAATAGGAITIGPKDDQIAKQIAAIQRKFIENLNSDAMVVACITALDRGTDTMLSKFCLSDLLPAIQRSQTALLSLILMRHWAAADAQIAAAAHEKQEKVILLPWDPDKVMPIIQKILAPPARK